ncbi:MAG TPA: hypothetical protein VFX61_01395 [Micromonosporaceae bacterium]|nr:hypothetical protein [Micromonosporaceae bacterium]
MDKVNQCLSEICDRFCIKGLGRRSPRQGVVVKNSPLLGLCARDSATLTQPSAGFGNHAQQLLSLRVV